MKKISNITKKLIFTFLILSITFKANPVSVIENDESVSICCEEAPNYSNSDCVY
jgi:hypothetical protein